MLSTENMNSTFVVEKVAVTGTQPTHTEDTEVDQPLVETLKRNYEITESFSECQQVSNQMQRTTDVNLICSDGIIPVHAAILQAVSPFFDKIFSVHGHHYFGICSVLLPDYTVSDFKKVVELIYHGKTTIASVLDGDNIKEILSYFEIKISSIELYQPEGDEGQVKSVLTLPLNNTESIQPRTDGSENSLDAKFEDVAAVQRKNLRPRDNLKKITAESQSDGDSDYDIEADQSERRRLKRAKVAKKHTEDNRNFVQPSGSNAQSHGGRTVSKTKTPGTSEKSRNVTESSEDDADDVKDADMGRFLNESKKCQYCGSQCRTAAAASICLTSHSRLRCYYCFKVVRNTEKLFQHFAKKHKQAGRENCLMCPFCEQTIPYKSVSCHVISMHLQNPAANKNKTDGNRRAIATTAAGASLQNHINMENKVSEQQSSGSGNSASSSKKRKLPNQGDKSSDESEKEQPEQLKLDKRKNGNESDDGEDNLMVRDLNTVIRGRSILTGKIRVFTLKKLRKLKEEAGVA